jgi:two-component system, NarL family, response regulator NreC
MTITLVLADDHLVVREGLRALLEAEPDFEVVGQTGNGSEVPALVAEVRPDILVLDLMMPGMGGLDVIREVTSKGAQTRIVVLSMLANEAYVVEALSTGAGAYVLKQSEAGELVRALREVAAGRRYLSPPLSDRALEAYLRQADAGSPDRQGMLTPRERQVLQLVAEGYTSAAIAEQLFISPRTVETHRSNLMRKLGLRTPAEVVRYAVRHGVLPEP